MENSIFQMIKELVEEKKSIPWKYYDGWTPSVNMDTLFTKDGANTFIEEYFSAGGKDHPLFFNPGAEEFIRLYRNNKESILTDQFFSIDKLPCERIIHMVSSFFVGILIEDALHGEQHLIATVQDYKEFPFSYIWFLTCLYHDIRYQFEQNIDFKNKIKNIVWKRRNYSHKKQRPHCYSALEKTFETLAITSSSRRQYHNDSINISHAIYCELLGYANNIRRHNISYSNGSVIQSPWYNEPTVRKYYAYRLLEMGKCDHGIIGGYLFLDRIIKNYVETYLEEFKFHRNILELENFDKVLYGSDQILHFCKEQLPIFRHISDCIIAHNIYKADANRESIYRDFDLQNLIGESFRQICYKKDPLLYILSLADTLDPVKVYGKSYDWSASEILKNIYFIYEPGAKHISIKTSPKLDITPIYKAALGLNEWTTAKVDTKTGSCFSITI